MLRRAPRLDAFLANTTSLSRGKVLPDLRQQGAQDVAKNTTLSGAFGGQVAGCAQLTFIFLVNL